MEILEDYKATQVDAPIAMGVSCSSMQGMLDCNDVDGNCINCD